MSPALLVVLVLPNLVKIPDSIVPVFYPKGNLDKFAANVHPVRGVKYRNPDCFGNMGVLGEFSVSLPRESFA
jgi:hypothetical protein